VHKIWGDWVSLQYRLFGFILSLYYICSHISNTHDRYFSFLLYSNLTFNGYLEVQKQIEDAKIELAEKKAEVEKIVTKVEEEVKKEKEEEDKAAGKAVHVETPEEIKEEIIEKEQIVEAVVKQEIQKTWCGGCQFGQMAFTCAKRVAWLMEAYGLNEEMAKEATMAKCGHRRKLRGNHDEVNNWEILVREMMQITPILN